ncbi:MFS transporter [Clostridium sp. PL3]|uniref:MFS transporter n=1 Tax=Clostridium thailandense TaxID=2794346 RepID=A0A949TPK6_9CLOT|nr:MFS transporter [Clostridium thailandense]MBV7276639.1 MFS transporter [Clostridium thailandense]
MRKVDINEIIDESKFNKFFLMVFMISFVTLIFDGYDMTVYGTTLTLMMKDLGLNATQTGFLASSALLGMVIGAIIFGMLADRIGRKFVIITGICFYALFTALCGFTSNPYIFAALRFLSGMGMAALTPVINSLLSEYSPKLNRNFLLSLANIGIPFGQLLCTFIGILIIQTTGWRTLYFIAVIPVFMIFFVKKYMPESMIFYHRKAEKDKIRDILEKANPEFTLDKNDEYKLSSLNNSKATLSSLFQNGLARNTILIWIMFFCNLYINFGMLTWLPKLMTMMGYSLKFGLVFTATYIGASCISIPVAGRFLNRFGFKKVLGLSYIITAIVFIAMTVKMSTTMFMSTFVIAGIFIGYQQSLTYVFASTSYPISIRGTAVGWGSSVARAGSFFAPIFVGMLISAHVSPTLTFATFAIPALIGFIAVSSTKKIPDFNSPASIDSIKMHNKEYDNV